jgi:hypothetical protein
MLWRHVGKYKGQVYLFDLADLFEGNPADFTQYVNDHCKMLKEAERKS